MFAHLLLALLERFIHSAALHPFTCLLPSEVAYTNLTQQSGSRPLQMSNCFPRPSVSRSSRVPMCLVAPGTRVVVSALAHCTSCKNSRWQCATGNEWNFPVVRCSHFDSQWPMLSVTFWEESQRKHTTKAYHLQLTVTCYETFASQEQLFFFLWISPDALSSFYVTIKMGEEPLCLISI